MNLPLTKASWVVALSSVVFGIAHGADTPLELAKQVQRILKAHCFKCHGEGGSNEGGFNFVLNRRRLVGRIVVAGKPDESLLLTKIRSGEMPQDADPLSQADQDAIRKWIASGAADFDPPPARKFITPEVMFAAMRLDLEKTQTRDRPFIRYFTLTHLYNAGFRDNELESHRAALSKLVNSLSWGRTIRVPQPIDPEKTILRIDVRHYQWNRNNAWDRLVAADPYHLTYAFPAAKYCYTATGCPLPHVRADWFVAAASRPPLYHDILGIPAGDKDADKQLEKLVGVDVDKNLKDYSDVSRAAFDSSGVSQNNRLIERHVSSYGAYWESYDFAGNEGRQDLFSHPLGPGDNERFFKHDGGEIIFNLPNGLQGYMLVTATGGRIDAGPTKIVVDKLAVKAGRNPDVVNGISCMSCHWSGMISKEDKIREHVKNRRASFTAEEQEAVAALYPPADKFAALLKEDRERFERAVKDCGSPLSESEPVATLALRFGDPLSLELASAEAGVTSAEFEKAIDRNPELGRALGRLTRPGETVPRDTFVQQFASLVTELRLGKYIAPNHARDTHKAGDERNDNALNLKLIWCPPGKFKMGSPASEENRQDDESQVNVELTQGFWLGKHEVTQGEFEKVMGTAPWQAKEFVKEGANIAANCISHDDAVEFCRKLTDSERKAGRLGPKEAYTLPTEAQWEYACRAGTTTAYSFGVNDARLGEFGWFSKNAFAVGEKYPHPVGVKKPNPFGLYDMHGNVWERCRDGYIEQLPGGTNPEVVDGKVRVMRGGSFYGDSGFTRSAFRAGVAPDLSDHDLAGFRLSRTP